MSNDVALDSASQRERGRAVAEVFQPIISVNENVMFSWAKASSQPGAPGFLFSFNLLRGRVVRPRRLELPRPFGHNDLNVARLPVPPRPHVLDAIGRGRWLAGERP